MALTYFTLEELRTLPDVSNTAKYPDARVTAVGEYVEAVIENFVGTSFTPRTVTDEVHDGGAYAINLYRPYVLSVTSATEDGNPVTDDLAVAPGGVLRRFNTGARTAPVRWATGYGNVTVTYQAGYSDEPPADIKEAAIRATRFRLMTTAATSGVDERTTSIQNDYGNVQLSVAGRNTPFGLPEIDAVLLMWSDRLNVFGFA